MDLFASKQIIEKQHEGARDEEDKKKMKAMSSKDA